MAVSGDSRGGRRPRGAWNRRHARLVTAARELVGEDNIRHDYAAGRDAIFATLERLLVASDGLDRAILRARLGGESSERIAESLSLEPETVRYRTRRLVTAVGMSSREELLDFIRAGSFEAIL